MKYFKITIINIICIICLIKILIHIFIFNYLLFWYNHIFYTKIDIFKDWLRNETLEFCRNYIYVWEFNVYYICIYTPKICNNFKNDEVLKFFSCYYIHYLIIQYVTIRKWIRYVFKIIIILKFDKHLYIIQYIWPTSW